MSQIHPRRFRSFVSCILKEMSPSLPDCSATAQQSVFRLAWIRSTYCGARTEPRADIPGVSVPVVTLSVTGRCFITPTFAPHNVGKLLQTKQTQPDTLLMFPLLAFALRWQTQHPGPLH
jgi:hypothetical protein